MTEKRHKNADHVQTDKSKESRDQNHDQSRDQNHNHSQKKEELLMDAIGAIDPRYIEEARQAVSGGSSGKNRTKLWKRRLLRSPAALLAAAACLTLLVLAGASRAGILQELLIISEKTGSTSNKTSASGGMAEIGEYDAEEGTYSSEEYIEEYVSAEYAGENENSAQGTDTEPSETEHTDNIAEAEAAEQSVSQIPTAPPDLNLKISGTSVLCALKNSYQWTYRTEKEPENHSTAACAASDVWTASDLPVLSLTSGSSITLDFGDVPPDTISLRYLDVSDRQNTDSQQDFIDLSIENDGSFTLPEDIRSCIVEVTAQWDEDLYSGCCTYGFLAEYESGQ